MRIRVSAGNVYAMMGGELLVIREDAPVKRWVAVLQKYRDSLLPMTYYRVDWNAFEFNASN